MEKKEKRAFLYRDVYERIRQDIKNGVLAPGDKLDCEDDLALAHNVSKITVKKALELLKADGVIDRVQGRGTFVRASIPPDAAGAQNAPRKKLVGLVLEHVSSPFGLDMLYELDVLLGEAGYTMLTRFSYGSAEREAREIDALMSMGIVALITMPCHDSYYSLTILKLILENFPVVLVDKRMHGLPVSTVCTDGADAVFRLVVHMQERGCQSAAILTIDPSSTTSLSDRVNGFYRAMRETGMLCAAEWVLPRRTRNMPSATQDEEYLARIRRFLKEQDPMPDGVIATEYALGRLLHIAAEQEGLTIGKDFKACCIDEDELAARGYVFTHMKQDEKAIARAVVDLLLPMIAGQRAPAAAVSIPAFFRQGITT